MTWLWLVGPLVLGAGALVPVLLRRRRPDPGGFEVRARAACLRLAHHVEVPPPVPPGDDHTTTLLRRATERWHSAGAVLADAATAEEFRLAERIATEGLAHTRDAYARLGLPFAE
ncbi:hypothetical protein [Saccharomonospora piscinae]|uniref:hypothetical protein n=1 Tax=Saccharomonospora piscinae TaxID=687388 RepID=UPI000465C884|nr:hypothetical protein [Saccharomonospora piscinae]